MTNGHTDSIKMPRIFILDTFGGIAVTALLICVISGVVLAVPFDVFNPYASISAFILSNPGAVIARNMHYWSAQIFLIFIILHIWDHFRLGTESAVRPGVWLRLGLGIMVILYAMLSGFILKGDVDSEEAMRIFNTLIGEIPLIGGQLAYILMGGEGSYLLLYVNHIAIATIFIIAILFEHARILWGKAVTFIVLGLILLLLSILFQAPLHDGLSGIIKGPWYFLGLQEILHWMHRPGWIWLILFVVMIPVFLMPFIKANSARIAKYFLFLAFVFYAVLTTIGYFFRGEEWQWSVSGEGIYMPFDPIPMKPGSFQHPQALELGTYERTESCLLCHQGMKGFSPSHDPDAIGCVSCHLGNPFVPDKDQAHAGMLYVPGNLDNASRSCGTLHCHPEITDRIHTSLMTTMSGIISVDRFVFNELELPEGHFNIEDIAHSPADQHLRNMCARCHLGNPKTEPGPVTQESRGGGCNACHLNYSDAANAELQKYYGMDMPDSSLWSGHPSLDLNISNDHCFGCHSRSGRISTSFEGWHETQIDKDEVHPSDTIRILADGRVFRFMAEDVHHKAGMLCIDCHDSYELMGDGTLYMHEEDQVKISCEDCHFERQPGLLTYANLDAETQKILQLKGIDEDNASFLPLNNTGRLIWNSKVFHDGDPVLIGKVSGKEHSLNAPADICRRGGAHDGLSCQSCHTAWVPQCIGCHNEYDPEIPGYDMIRNKEETGSWVEYVGKYMADLPTLGVVDGVKRRVHTFVPGMILTIDKGTYDPGIEDPLIFHRLYAPLSAHTTISEGRSCRSCHNDPLALGYGHGKLTYSLENGVGSWHFVPRFASNPNDRLPEDAWIAFLQQPDGNYSTRTNTRPFSLEEQRKILLVGSCLECHDQNSELMLSTLDDFEEILKRRSVRCILPDYF